MKGMKERMRPRFRVFSAALLLLALCCALPIARAADVDVIGPKIDIEGPDVDIKPPKIDPQPLVIYKEWRSGPDVRPDIDIDPQPEPHLKSAGAADPHAEPKGGVARDPVTWTVYANGKRLDPQPTWTWEVLYSSDDLVAVRYTSERLPVWDYEREVRLVYTITEKVPRGYTVTYLDLWTEDPNETAFLYPGGTAINTKTESPYPQTGDRTPLAPLLGLMLLSGVGLYALARAGNARSPRKDDDHA